MGVPARFQAEITTAPAANVAAWWRSFDDPLLTQLVELALVANSDIEVAGARVRQARAALRSTQAGSWPTLDFGTTAAERRAVGSDAVVADRTTYQAGFDAGYEVDLFGGQRRAVQASRADLQSVEAALHSTQLTVAAEVALNYVELRLAQRQLSISQANLAAQDETLQIVYWRVQAGLVGSLDLEQARRLRAQTAATVPAREQAVRVALNRLSALTGAVPGTVDPAYAVAAPVPVAPVPGMTVPADMLRRRPDVRGAEQALVAETARIGVREADLYPALRLSGTLSGNSSNWGDLTAGSISTLVAGLTVPLFEGGRLRAAVEQQRAVALQAQVKYRDTVLLALEEAENALFAIDTAQRRELDLVIAEEAARNAATLARSQYQVGLIDFATLLDAERSLLVSEDTRAGARAARATATIQLYKALGGGWDVAPLPRTLTQPLP